MVLGSLLQLIRGSGVPVWRSVFGEDGGIFLTEALASHGWGSLFTPVPSLIHHEEVQGYEHHSFKSFLLKRNTVHWLLKAGRRRSASVPTARCRCGRGSCGARGSATCGSPTRARAG